MRVCLGWLAAVDKRTRLCVTVSGLTPSPYPRARVQEAAREEIDDLAMEHEAEREELLDSIRNQNKELQLWEQVR